MGSGDAVSNASSYDDNNLAGRAKQQIRDMEAQYHITSKVERDIAKHFGNRCSFEGMEIVPHGDTRFAVFVFFKTNNDLESYKRAGILQEIIEFVYVEFASAGLGGREELTVVFEFDSDENVKENYGGSYQLRMS